MLYFVTMTFIFKVKHFLVMHFFVKKNCTGSGCPRQICLDSHGPRREVALDYCLSQNCSHVRLAYSLWRKIIMFYSHPSCYLSDRRFKQRLVVVRCEIYMWLTRLGIVLRKPQGRQTLSNHLGFKGRLYYSHSHTVFR